MKHRIIRGSFAKLFVFLLALNVIGSNASEGRSVGADGGEVRSGGQRVLFDQLMDSLASKYLPAYVAGGHDAGMQWSVHPFPLSSRSAERLQKREDGVREKRQNTFANSAAAGNDDQDSSSTGSVDGAGNAIPASVLAAAASASSTGGSAGSSSERSPSIPSSFPSASATQTPWETPASLPPSPSSTSIPALTSTPRSPSSSSSLLPAPSTKQETSNPSNPDPDQSFSLLNPKHNLFPLIIAGLSAAGFLAIMLLIAIARAIAHESLRRDNLRKTYSFDNTTPSSKSEVDKYTSPFPNRGGVGSSLKRAMTKKKPLGSFARRTQDGSVLIEVGDEVLAVPPHLADSYREWILREKRNRSTLSGERGGFGVEAKYLNDGGPDGFGGDEEQARAAYDNMLEGGGVRRSLSQKLGDRFRSLTATKTAIRGETERGRAFSFSSEHQPPGAMRQANLGGGNKGVLTSCGEGWSIVQRQQGDVTKTPGPPFGTARVLERFTSITQPPATYATKAAVARKAPPRLELTLLTEKLQDLEKQSSSSSSSSSTTTTTTTSAQSTASRGDRRRGGLPKEASLTGSSGDSANGTFGGSASSHSETCTRVPGAFPERTKSLHQSAARRAKSVKPLILNMDPTAGTGAGAGVGGYKGRKADATQRSRTQVVRQSRRVERVASVALASPTRFTHERCAKLVVAPERPEAALAARPLPVPPSFSQQRKA
ncbi:uncharacterized protein UHO2_02280 [Ustilago hordei]|uniref:Transmembrane protein n=1 Tax=Ustilago hordei TaxID=120017 RepID=I2G746_USTHO|nr:uncharacterized protein UHO2_02280 [Ustilago hordei]CCF54989.1 uncharacterized protein UHOR_01315 [Ustilago hordei]SYW86046.1 uncharacterized protein UHO2_02280 [Ustilago hordei]